MKHSEIIKDVRSEAKKLGLTLKRSNFNINGAPAYHFACRLSGRELNGQYTLPMAYENIHNGYVESLKLKISC